MIKRNLLYLIAFILIIVWAIGIFIYTVGFIIHLLLIAAAILILTNVVKKKTRSSEKSDHLNQDRTTDSIPPK